MINSSFNLLKINQFSEKVVKNFIIILDSLEVLDKVDKEKNKFNFRELNFIYSTFITSFFNLLLQEMIFSVFDNKINLSTIFIRYGSRENDLKEKIFLNVDDNKFFYNLKILNLINESLKNNDFSKIDQCEQFDDFEKEIYKNFNNEIDKQNLESIMNFFTFLLESFFVWKDVLKVTYNGLYNEEGELNLNFESNIDLKKDEIEKLVKSFITNKSNINKFKKCSLTNVFDKIIISYFNENKEKNLNYETILEELAKKDKNYFNKLPIDKIKCP